MSTLDPALGDVTARMEQAAKNAAWWCREIAAGRVTMTADLRWLLRDLETAGGLR